MKREVSGHFSLMPCFCSSHEAPVFSPYIYRKSSFEALKRSTCSIRETPLFSSIAVIIFAFSEIQFTSDKNVVNKTVSDIMNAAMLHKCYMLLSNA